tara:strand:- start:3734 stop:5497 length:1764 start_codon:yes stop_codon:yes gene_type:complete
MSRRDRAGQIRRSQYIYTYGPGSIVNVKVGPVTMSLCMGDLRTWEFKSSALTRKYQQVVDERIIRELKSKFKGFDSISHFRLPPVDPSKNDDTSALWASIFPSWLLCPQCRSLYDITDDEQSRDCHRMERGVRRYCNKCSNQQKKVWVVPTRFVIACKNGHLDSFDYKWWLNNYGKNVDKDCPHDELRLLQNEGSLAITNLTLKCKQCEGKASLSDIFKVEYKCSGKKPWEYTEEFPPKREDCKERCRVQQRNSRSIWQRINLSALAIPPLDYEFPKMIGPETFDEIKDANEEDRKVYVRLKFKKIADLWKTRQGEDMPYTQDTLLEKINQEIAKYEELSSDIYQDEYEVLMTEKIEKINEFKKIMHNIPKSYPKINAIAEVQKLKVVDAVIGFTRVNGDPIFYQKNSFLPAVEVFGEGFFINFDQKFINNFIKNKYIQEEFNFFKNNLEPAEKRKILLHSIAHCILKATARFAGYSITSIKERLYVSEKMSGILIYTSSSDSEGTLGGLSRLAEPDRISEILKEAEKISLTCSSDPLCGEGLYTEGNENNGSVCHSCLIVPETSCDFQNEFLSRGVTKTFWDNIKK